MVNYFVAGFFLYLSDKNISLRFYRILAVRFNPFSIFVIQVGNKVRSYFPPDDATSRKNLLYGRIYDGLDKIDGKPTQAERKVRGILVPHS